MVLSWMYLINYVFNSFSEQPAYICLYATYFNHLLGVTTTAVHIWSSAQAALHSASVPRPTGHCAAEYGSALPGTVLPPWSAVG